MPQPTQGPADYSRAILPDTPDPTQTTQATPAPVGAPSVPLQPDEPGGKPFDRPVTADNLTSPSNVGTKDMDWPVRALDTIGAGVLGAGRGAYDLATHPINTIKNLAGTVADSARAYADPATRPTLEGVGSVLPEALGYGLGSELGGRAIAGAGKSALDTLSPSPRSTGGEASAPQGTPATSQGGGVQGTLQKGGLLHDLAEVAMPHRVARAQAMGRLFDRFTGNTPAPTVTAPKPPPDMGLPPTNIPIDPGGVASNSRQLGTSPLPPSQGSGPINLTLGDPLPATTTGQNLNFSINPKEPPAPGPPPIVKYPEWPTKPLHDEARNPSAPPKPPKPEVFPITQWPTQPEHSAIRGAQASVARTNARQIVPLKESPTPAPAEGEDTGTGTDASGPNSFQAGTPALQLPGDATAPKSSLIQSPTGPKPSQQITYQSVERADLQRMLREGDKNALYEWQRRGLPLPQGFEYLVEPGRPKVPHRKYDK